MLGSRGRSFSAGADLNWMREAAEAPTEENEAIEALKQSIQEIDGVFHNAVFTEEPGYTDLWYAQEGTFEGIFEGEGFFEPLNFLL